MEIAADLNTKQRNRNIKVQIYLTLLLRGISVFLSFYVIRLTIDFLGKDLYGIWIVLLSIIAWFSLFDVGIGNGLRNKLTIALATKDMVAAKAYVSTSYIILSFIAILVFSIFIISAYFINWQSVFNSKLLSIQQYTTMMIMFIGGIVISFVLSLINSILNAYQKSALTNIATILTNVLFLCVLFFYKTFYYGNLVKIVSLFCACLIISNTIITVYFFIKNRELTPSFKDYSKSKIKDILTLGGNFFIIQIAVLLIFTVDNFVVLQLFGTEQVSIYNIVFKLFSVFTIGFGIIISPLWSAFTEAKEKSDFVWMKTTLTKLNKLMLIVILGLLTMLFAYQQILDFWLPSAQRIRPDFSLILAFSLFILISTWNNIYSYFLNGMGIVKMQVKTAVIGALINVPLAVFFGKVLNFGLPGVVLAMCVSLFIFSVLGPMETYKFLKRQTNE